MKKINVTKIRVCYDVAWETLNIMMSQFAFYVCVIPPATNYDTADLS